MVEWFLSSVEYTVRPTFKAHGYEVPTLTHLACPSIQCKTSLAQRRWYLQDVKSDEDTRGTNDGLEGRETVPQCCATI